MQAPSYNVYIDEKNVILTPTKEKKTNKYSYNSRNNFSTVPDGKIVVVNAENMTCKFIPAKTNPYAY